jgi:hypothetical protein
MYAKHVSGFRTKIFSPLGVASVTAELNLRESLESGKIYAKHDKPLIRSRGRALERKYGTTLFDSYSGKIIMHWLAKLTGKSRDRCRPTNQKQQIIIEKNLAVLYVVVLAMWSMTAMKKQKSNDGIRGLFFLEPWYTLWPVGIDKSWPIHTSSQFFNALNFSTVEVNFYTS